MFNITSKKKKIKNNKLKQLLIESIRENDFGNLENLINNNKKISTQNIFTISELNKSGRLPSKNLSLIHLAAFYDSLESFILLEKELGLSPNQESIDSLHPIHYACISNSLEIIVYILNIFPEEAKIRSPTPYNLYFLASISSSNSLIKLLTEFGAHYPDTLQEQFSPTQIAIAKKDIKTLKALLNARRNASINFQDFSPLMTAILYNDKPTFDFLLNNNEKIVYFTPNGNCPISLACFLNKHDNNIDSNYNIIKILLKETEGVEIEEKNSNNDGAIQWICRSNSPSIAKLFFYYHPEINVNRINESNQTALSILRDSSLNANEVIEMISLFIENGFDLNFYNVLNKTKTALELFISSISPDPVIINFLLDKGANPYLPFIGNSNDNATILQVIYMKCPIKIQNIFEKHMQSTLK